MENIKSQFLLDPEIRYLNHGAFGACPKPIFEDYLQWQHQLEFNPTLFMTETGKKQLTRARNELAKYLNCSDNDLVLMPNPTTAMNTFIRSFPLASGDEILSTNQEYGAIAETWKYYCKKQGANFIEQKIPTPFKTKEEVIASFWKGLSPRTKAIFVSHITSSTALIFPVKEICKQAKEKGLITILDGAHVPGHIPLDLDDINADVYTGTCHKWMLTPKGSSFLHVRSPLKETIEPLIISWGYVNNEPTENRFHDYHQFNGTKDYSAYLTIPASRKFFSDTNWESLMQESRKTLLDHLPMLTDAFNCKLLFEDNAFMSNICSFPIQSTNALALKQELRTKYQIELPLMTNSEGNYIRVSFMPYCNGEDLEALTKALHEIRTESGLLN